MKTQKVKLHTQKGRVLQHLIDGGTLTGVQAWEKFKCYRLASVINKLKDEGHQITKERVKAGGHTFARYSLTAVAAAE